MCYHNFPDSFSRENLRKQRKLINAERGARASGKFENESEESVAIGVEPIESLQGYDEGDSGSSVDFVFFYQRVRSGTDGIY